MPNLFLFSVTSTAFFSRGFALFTLLFLSLFAHAQAAQSPSPSSLSTGDIHIQVPIVPEGTQGFLLTIYRDKQNFLKQADEEYYLGIDKLSDGQLTLPNIAHGQIALSLAADMDGNKKLKTRIFGIPAEPVGFVNNPKPKFGPPSFRECLFTHDKSSLIVSITLQEL